jgi:hypothetical protein
MKSGLFLFVTFTLLSVGGIFAQTAHGLEKIIVEKYYVSDEKDSKATWGGYLPVGSVTYRIFVDLLPVYRLQAVYGVPGHELRVSTTTSFFNNEESGAAVANDIPGNKLNENTVMLDSWLSVGAAAEGVYAVLKSDDTSKALINADGLLQNDDPSAGIPVKVRDGMFPSTRMSIVSFFGIDSTMLAIFNNTNTKTKGQVFSTDNGSWASFGGAVGPHPQNRVLIAQLTTDGDLSFELNIQIGTPTGGVENYVARNPVGNEIQFDGLIYPYPAKNNTVKMKGKEALKNDSTQ